MSGQPPTAVFDFDLTLTNWDTAERFFRWLLWRDRWRMGLLICALPIIGPLFLVKATRKWPLRLAIWVATLGRSHEDLQSLVREHAEAVSSGPSSVFLQAGLKQLQSHMEQGHQVVIATGCLEVLARELLARAGYGHVPLVGSTLRPFLGGMVRHQHCFGHNKVPMLAAYGFVPPWAVSYTDHQCDLPVLELSRERYLVNPQPKAIRLIQQALAPPATILIWQ